MSVSTPSTPGPAPRVRSLRSDWKGYAVIGAALAAFFIYKATLPTPKDGQTHPAVGNKMRTFEVQPLIHTSAPFTSEQLRGKVTLINLWGPWCPHCREELPYLMQLRAQYGDQMQFVFVSYPDSGSANADELRRESEGLMRMMKLEFPVYQDPRLEMQGYLNDAGIFWKGSFPFTMLLDREGTVRGVWMQFKRSYVAEMQELIQPLMTGTQVPPEAL